MSKELEKFHNTLEHIEKAFYLVAANDNELKVYGLRRLRKWFDFNDLLPLLDSFSVQLSVCQRIIEIVDKKNHEKLVDLLKETNLEDLITRFSVKLRIADKENSRVDPTLLWSALGVVFKRKITNDLFANNDISIEGLLSAIARIKSLLLIVSDEIKHKHETDDEIFKPSNININNVTIEIDAAITCVQESSGLSLEQQEKLIDYLTEAKVELSKKEPSWRKVIGALVISATLLGGLGGIAAAPQAAENIDKAINYILGTSILNKSESKFELPMIESEHKQRPKTHAI